MGRVAQVRANSNGTEARLAAGRQFGALIAGLSLVGAMLIVGAPAAASAATAPSPLKAIEVAAAVAPNDPPAWTVTGPNVGGYLHAVACPSASECWAVGVPQGKSGDGELRLWNGTAWSTAFLATGGVNQFYGVTCVSTADCWAVGDTNGGEFAHWNGTSWSGVPGPSVPSGELTSVACAGANVCWAAGTKSAGTLSAHELLYRWDGATWSAETIGAVPGRTNGFSSVACVSTSDCWVMGTLATYGTSATLAYHWNASTWSYVPTPDAAAHGSIRRNAVTSVTCVTSNDCWAVGNFVTLILTPAFSMHWDGTSWSLVSLPTDTTWAQLYGVSCLSASDCWAVGTKTVFEKVTAPTGGTSTQAYAVVDYVLNWNGSSWQRSTVPNPAVSGEPVDGLFGATCATGRGCMLVGGQQSSAGGQFLQPRFTTGETLAMVGTGAALAPGTPPPPPPPVPQPPGGYSATAVNGSGTLDRHSTVCSTTRPVNCASGNFWHTFTDAKVPGRGPALDLARTYNSLNATAKGIFGYGWSSSYDQHLVLHSDGSVTVVATDGSQVTATPTGGGAYTVPSWADSTLAQNPDGTFTFVEHQTETLTFSSSGQLLAIADRNGYTTTLGYAADGQLSSATDPAGRKLQFTFGSNGLVSKVTDPMGHTTTYAYDARGNLTSVTDPMGRTTKFTYDASHRMLAMTDPRGGTTTNVYDTAGQVTSQTDPMGRTTTFAYTGTNFSSTGGTTTITDPNGNVETEQYTGGELMTLTEAAGTPDQGVWRFTYDPVSHGRTSITDPNGHTTTNTYDAQGNLLTTTDPLGRTTTTTYNAFDEPTSITDPAGVTTTFTYDAHGNLLSQSTPDGSTTVTTTYTYGDANPGDVTGITDPNGHTWALAYDAQGDLVSVTNPTGDQTTSTYDADGNRTSVTSPEGNTAGANKARYTTTYAYDADNELISTTNPLGQTTTASYDADGNVVGTTDPSGHTTTYAYDADNELTSTTNPTGHTTSTSYDKDGNVVASTDANGHTTTSAYNARNELVSQTNPLGATTTYAYDATGNLVSTTDPRGVSTTNSYDAANELVSVAYSDKTPGVSYTYDADGRRLTMTDGTGTTTDTYDALGRLLSETNGAGAAVTYTYDPAGNVTAIGYPTGHTVTQGYDASNRLTSVTDWLGNTTTFSYDANSNLASEHYPNGVVATSSFNPADELTGITDTEGSSTLAAYSYVRNATALITSSTTAGVPGAPASQAFTYTQANQLASVNATTYVYDPAGNLTKTTQGSQSYNAGDELTTSTAGSGTETFTYDATGNRTGASGPGTSAQDCVLCVLSPTAKGAVTSKGNASITASGVIAVDSTAKGAISATGSATVSGPAIFASGTTTTKGTAKVTTLEPQGSGIATDPFAGLSVPVLPGTPTSLEAKATHSVTATPGVYSTLGASGSATLTLSPGTYVVTGKLSATAGSTVTGTGVTVYLACSSYPQPCAPGAKGAGITVSGASAMTLAGAPASGGSSPLAVLADTNDVGSVKAEGSGTLRVTGSIGGRSLAFSTTGAASISVSGGVLSAEDVSAEGSGKVLVDGGTGTNGPAATTYSYDGADRLVSLTTPTQTSTYAYNGAGLRMSETVDGASQQFTWDTAGSVPSLLADGANAYVYGPGGAPLEQVARDGTVTYLQTDQLGSVRAITDAHGNVVGSQSFGPYGVLTSRTGSVTTPFGFTGAYTDQTGLVYLVNRYYTPGTGSFLSVDPARNFTRAPYSYAGDNPTNRADPTGLWWCLPAGAYGPCPSGYTDTPPYGMAFPQPPGSDVQSEDGGAYYKLTLSDGEKYDFRPNGSLALTVPGQDVPTGMPPCTTNSPTTGSEWAKWEHGALTSLATSALSTAWKNAGGPSLNLVPTYVRGGSAQVETIFGHPRTWVTALEEVLSLL